jgi:hypothetical protein
LGLANHREWTSRRLKSYLSPSSFRFHDGCAETLIRFGVYRALSTHAVPLSPPDAWHRAQRLTGSMFRPISANPDLVFKDGHPCPVRLPPLPRKQLAGGSPTVSPRRACFGGPLSPHGVGPYRLKSRTSGASSRLMGGYLGGGPSIVVVGSPRHSCGETGLGSNPNAPSTRGSLWRRSPSRHGLESMIPHPKSRASAVFTAHGHV